MNRIVPVIMSGGSGTRLWPVSRIAHPKQLHALVSEMSMVQETVNRVAGRQGDIAFADPIIILNEIQHELAETQLRAMGVADARFVIEPVGRNTAPVAAAAADLVSSADGEDSLILLLPADHHIKDGEAFMAAIRAAAALAMQGRIVTFGIEPDAPETGYGYIHRGASTGGGFDVKAFTEKPDRKTAESFLASREYYWNAGIFMFCAGAVRAEMRRHCPDVLDAVEYAMKQARTDAGHVELDRASFGDCPSISFDYALMERTERAAVVPVNMGWSDVGSWAALWDLAEKDHEGNALRGDVTVIGGANNYVVSDDHKVALIGVDDLVVVTTRDAVLVSRREDSQEVKRVVEELKTQGRLDLL